MKKMLQEQIPRVKAMIKSYIPKLQESIIKGVNPGFKKYKRALQLALIVGAVKLAALAIVAFIMWWMSCKPACEVVNVPDLRKVVNDMACDPFLSDGGWVKSSSVSKSRAEFYADVVFDQFNFEAVPKEIKAAQAKARKPPKPLRPGAKRPPPPAPAKKNTAATKKPVVSYLDSFTPLNLWGPFLGAVSEFTSEILKNASSSNAPSLNSIPRSQDVSVSRMQSTKYGKAQPVYQKDSFLNVTLEYNKPRQLQRTTKKPAPSGRRKLMAEEAHDKLTINSQGADATPALAPASTTPAPGLAGKKRPEEIKESLMTILQFAQILKRVKEQHPAPQTVGKQKEGDLQQLAAGVQPAQDTRAEVPLGSAAVDLNMGDSRTLQNTIFAATTGASGNDQDHAVKHAGSERRSLLQTPAPTWVTSGSTLVTVSALFFPLNATQWGQQTHNESLFVGFFEPMTGLLDQPPIPGYVFGNFSAIPSLTSSLISPGFALNNATLTGSIVNADGVFTNGYFAPTLAGLQSYWSNNTQVSTFLSNFTADPANLTARFIPLPTESLFPWLAMAPPLNFSLMPPMLDLYGEDPDPFGALLSDPAFADAMKDPALAALLSDPTMLSAMGDFSGMGGNMAKLFGAVSEFGIDFTKVEFSDLGIKEPLPGLGAGGTIDFDKLKNDPAAANTLLSSMVSIFDTKYPAPNAPPDYPPAPGGVGAPYGYGESIKYDSGYFEVQQFDFPYSAEGDGGQPIGCDKTLFNMAMGTNWMSLNQKRMNNASKHLGFGRNSKGNDMIHGLQVRYTLSWRTCASLLRTAAVAADTTMNKEDYRLFSYTTSFFEQLDALGLDPPEFCQYTSQKDSGVVDRSDDDALNSMDSARFWLPGLPYGRNNTNNSTKAFRNQTSYWCITLGSGMFTDVNRLLNPNSKKKPSINLRDLKLFDTAFRAFGVLTNDTNPDAVMVTMSLAIRSVAEALMRTAQDLKDELATSLADVSLQCCKIRCQAIFSVVGMALGYLAWIELVVGSICLVAYIAIATHVPKFKDPKVKYSDVFSVVVSRVMGQVAGDILEKTGAGEKLEAIKGEAMGAAQEAFGDEIDKAKGAISSAQSQAENLKGQAEAMKAEAESAAGGSKEAWAAHPNSVGAFQVVSVSKAGSLKSAASLPKK